MCKEEDKLKSLDDAVTTRRLTTLKVTASALGAMFALMLAPQCARAQDSDQWHFEATIYAYLPSIDWNTTFPPANGGSDISIDGGKILESLQLGFMGTLDVRKGAWGVFTDIIYLNFGSAKSGDTSMSIGNIPLPVGVAADTHMDLEASLWTLAGTHRVVDSPANSVDLLAGVRMIDIATAFDWRLTGNVGPVPIPDRSGARESDLQNWDAIIGVRGRASLGQAGHWFIPYEFDIGAGESSFAWQAVASVGYAFGWGSVLLGWRFLDYQMKSGSEIKDMTFSGPGLAAQFQW